VARSRDGSCSSCGPRPRRTLSGGDVQPDVLPWRQERSPIKEAYEAHRRARRHPLTQAGFGRQDGISQLQLEDNVYAPQYTQVAFHALHASSDAMDTVAPPQKGCFCASRAAKMLHFSGGSAILHSLARALQWPPIGTELKLSLISSSAFRGSYPAPSPRRSTSCAPPSAESRRFLLPLGSR